MTGFKIGKRLIGKGHPPLVIPEVGINHEGDIDKALQMVDSAKEMGAEIIKFQYHIVEQEMIPTDITPGQISDETLWDIIKRCELTGEEEQKVQSHCQAKGLIYLSTPFSREAADRLEEMDVPAFKIGSGECNNLPLLRHIAEKGRPIILSTGMNDISSIRRSVDVIREQGAPLALMHCTSMYPTPYDKVRLGAIQQLQAEFPDLPIGLSDHSLNIWTCLGAVALGACLVEKHFTISRSWPGPDTPISIEPVELSRLVEGVNAIWQARGGYKEILPDEQPVIDFAYATVVAIAPIKKGDLFNRTNTWVKRPGTGPIPASRLEDVLGSKAREELQAETHIRPEDIEGFD